MSNYDNKNRGALFDNDRKQSDKHPDMTGKIDVDGQPWEISGWWKETKAGRILSLSVKPPWKPAHQGRTVDPPPLMRKETPPMAELNHDEIPF